jgi:pyridoxine 4-dehydrogenase
MQRAFVLDYCASEGLTPAALALASLLHPSRVMLAIPGTSSVTHVEENRQGALVRLTDEHFAALSGAV